MAHWDVRVQIAMDFACNRKSQNASAALSFFKLDGARTGTVTGPLARGDALSLYTKVASNRNCLRQLDVYERTYL